MVLLEAFAELPDPRAENRRYPLPHLIFIAITMVLSSADDSSSRPSHDTFGRIFARLDPEAFQAAFVAWVA